MEPLNYRKCSMKNSAEFFDLDLLELNKLEV